MRAAAKREVTQSNIDISSIFGLRRRCIGVHAFILQSDEIFSDLSSFYVIIIGMGTCISKEEEEYLERAYYGTSASVVPIELVRPASVYIYEEIPVSMLRIRVPKESNTYMDDIHVRPGRVYQE